MSTLVFLEHHDGELQKGSLGVLAKAALARRRGRRRRRLRRRALAARRGRARRDDGVRRRRPDARRAAAAAARRRARAGRRGGRLRHRPLRRSRCSPPTSPPASPRGSTPGSTGTWSTSRATDGTLVGKRPALGDSRLRRRRLDARRRAIALFRSGTLRAGRDGRRGARSSRRPAELEDFSTAATMLEQAHEEQAGPVDRGRGRHRRRRPRARRPRGTSR